MAWSLDADVDDWKKERASWVTVFQKVKSKSRLALASVQKAKRVCCEAKNAIVPTHQ